MLRLPTNTYTSGLTQGSALVPASSNQPPWSDKTFTPISYNSAFYLSTVTSSALTTTWSLTDVEITIYLWAHLQVQCL